MESKLVGKVMLERMLAAKDPGSIAAMLLQTHYKQDVEKFGGVKAMGTLVDFVLSKNLGSETSKLISIAPKDQRGIVTAIAGVWDISNIKLAIEALGSGKGYDDISRYLIDSKYAGPSVVKEVLNSKNVENALERLSLRTPYSNILEPALDTYKKTKNVVETNDMIEKLYYLQLGYTISKLSAIDRNAAELIKRRIDMRNLLTLLSAKKHGMEPSEISAYLLPNGSIGIPRLEKIFKDAKSFDSLTEGTKVFDLKQALESYNSSKNKPLLLFEIAMMNQIFRDALRTVQHSVLSFGVMIGFFYLKEIEAFTLRILIKGRNYGLTEDEIRGMISWLK